MSHSLDLVRGFFVGSEEEGTAMKPYILYVDRYMHGWHVVLNIGNQSFHMEAVENRQAARWFKKMLGKALDRMLTPPK